MERRRHCGDERHGLQKERLLDGAGLGGLLLHAFALEALEPEEAGVLNGDGNVSGKRLKHLELVRRWTARATGTTGALSQELARSSNGSKMTRSKERIQMDILKLTGCTGESSRSSDSVT
jgi:hypothetical protein